MKTLAIALVFPFLCLAADARPEIDSVLDLARGAPGEFAADAMIRIAALDTVDKTRRVKLLEEAFHRAAEAQQPYKRRAGIVRVAGNAGFLNHVYEQDLDAFSLRLRAVRGLLPLDGRKARDLFLEIPRIQLPPVTCSDYMVFDVSEFYDTLGSVARESFNAAEIGKDEPFHLLQQFTAAITSPAQVGPMAALLGNVTVKDTDFAVLMTSFSAALGKIRGDDRSFTHETTAGAKIAGLVEACKRRKVSPLPLIEAYRLYLVNNLTAARCADDDLMQNGAMSFGLDTGRPLDQQSENAAAFFNEKIRVAPLQPIQEQETSPEKIEGVASGLRSCEDPECQVIVTHYRDLLFDTNGLAYPGSKRATPEWAAQMTRFLGDIADWKETTTASAAQQYREKCGIYSDLLNVVPNGAARETVLRAILDYVQRNKFQTESRMEWFLPVNTLIGRVGLDPLGMGKVAEELRKASDPIIALYAQLEIVAPRPPERIMGLL